MRRTIDQWLRAGGREAGGVTPADIGVPQGAGGASILANVFGRLFGRKGTVADMLS
jgi:hypothetical protein